MNLNYIKAFYYVAKLGSISQAARYLNLAQPTVTKKIRLLEEEIDKSLIQRGSRGVRLTDHGQQFYNHAKNVIEEIHRLEEQFYGTKSDVLELSTTQGIGAYLLPRVLSNVKDRIPMPIHIRDSSMLSLEDMVATDVYLGPFVEGLEKTHQVQHLHDFVFHFYASPSYLSKHKVPKKIEDLKFHDMIGFDDERKNAFEETKLSFVITDPDFQAPKFNTKSTYSEVDMANRGMGIALLADVSVKHFNAKVQKVELDDFAGVKTPAYFFTKKETGRDKALLIQELYSSFQEDLKQLSGKA